MNRGQRYDEMVTSPKSDELGFFEKYSDNLKLVQDRIRELTPKRIYDLGCGTGNLTGILSDDMKVFGLDKSEEMLIQCREKYPNMHTIEVDVIEALNSIDITNEDLVVSSFLFHGIKEKSDLLSWIKSCIDKGCKVIILDYIFKDEQDRISKVKEFRDSNKEVLANIIESKHYMNIAELEEYANEGGFRIGVEMLTHWIALIEMN